VPEFLAAIVGTMLLIIFGEGVCANVSERRGRPPACPCQDQE